MTALAVMLVELVVHEATVRADQLLRVDNHYSCRKNTLRKIQNPNDSLRFMRNPSKYSSNIEGNEVVEMLDNRRFNQTPNLEFILDGDY